MAADEHTAGSEGSGSGPAISIIIPTLNSAQDLPRLLNSLARQTMADFEILVVDGGSSDGTEGLAASYGCRVLRGNKMADSKNMGARSALGNALLFLDSDMEAYADLLATCAAMLHRFPVLYLREEVVSESWWAKARGFEKRATFHSKLYEVPRCFIRGIFEMLGGFDERFGSSGEDIELEARILKGQIDAGWVDNPPLLHYEVGLGLTEYLAKRYGRSIDLLRVTHPTFWNKYTSPAARLKMLLKQFGREPSARSAIYIGMVAAQRLLEYRSRVTNDFCCTSPT